MATDKRLMLSFEVTKEEMKAIEQRAKQEGVNRSQYVKEAIFLEFMLSGDVEAYTFLAKHAGVVMKETLAGKLRDLERGRTRKE